MHIDFAMSVAGLVVGTLVGLTGMGGGALMTPILILIFGVAPDSAVASDLVASLVMKPIGGGIHWRAATVHRGIVKWLVAPALPAAFLGAYLLSLLSAGGGDVQDKVKLALGAALLMAFLAMVIRQFYVRRYLEDDGLDSEVKPLPTFIIGALGGVVVGMTSVGSGSMIIVALMWLYPQLSNRALVGTNLVQAVPLVAAAALGQAIFGEVQLAVTGSLLVGAIPGVFVGAQISSRTTAPWLRPILAGVLLASALKLLDAPTMLTGAAAVVAAAALLAIGSIVARRGAAESDAAAASRDTAARADLSEV